MFSSVFLKLEKFSEGSVIGFVIVVRIILRNGLVGSTCRVFSIDCKIYFDYDTFEINFHLVKGINDTE